MVTEKTACRGRRGRGPRRPRWDGSVSRWRPVPAHTQDTVSGSPARSCLGPALPGAGLGRDCQAFPGTHSPVSTTTEGRVWRPAEDGTDPPDVAQRGTHARHPASVRAAVVSSGVSNARLGRQLKPQGGLHDVL